MSAPAKLPRHPLAFGITYWGPLPGTEAVHVRTADIRALRAEAIEHGDFERARLCDKALAGAVDGPNWQDCARVIARSRLEAS